MKIFVVCIEGLNRSGKTSHSELLKKRLHSNISIKNQTILKSRESNISDADFRECCPVEEEKEEVVKLIGYTFAVNCLRCLILIMDIKFPPLSVTMGKKDKKDKNSCDNISIGDDIHRMKILVSNVFEYCDLLRSALRRHGLKIEDL